MSKCHKCNKDQPCGCDPPLRTTSFPDCVSANICSEFVYTGCIIYNGPEFTDLNIAPGMTLNQVIQALGIMILAGGSDHYCYNTNLSVSLSPILSIINIDKTSIDIGWIAISNVDDYTFSYSDDDWATQTDISVASSATHYKVTGLTCGITYSFMVSANHSPSICLSIKINVTTLAC